MKLFRLAFILGLFAFLHLFPNSLPPSNHRALSQESDPDGFVKHVSVIHGNYVDTEVDAVIQGPDPLFIARFYNSQDKISETNLGGWRLFPYCYLFIQKDSLKGEYTTAEGKYENTSLFVSTEKGDFLPYTAWHNTTQPKTITLFELDIEKSEGLANTTRGEITAWTNQKNNKAYYHSENQTIEFFPSCGSKRTYVKSHQEGCFYLQHEVLPSGNKIFYQYDDEDRLSLVEMKNSTEKKTISWVKISYGNSVEITTSDLKSISYRFMKYDAEHILLAEVIRSQKPSFTY